MVESLLLDNNGCGFVGVVACVDGAVGDAGGGVTEEVIMVGGGSA